MQLEFTPEYQTFRHGVVEFLASAWPAHGDESRLPPKDQERQFRQKAIEQGYLYRSLPRQYGGSEQPIDLLKANIIRSEFSRVGAPMGAPGSISLLVPTLLTHGAEWQKQQFIPPGILGEVRWCQGYSEPNAGSDLASVRTRAELVGDEWVINGQKVWTSYAHISDYMFALVRTEPDAAKHDGISYLLLRMDQPGIEVRPLTTLTGDARFNEVFFTDARTPADWIVGERGRGWQVSRTTLKQERVGAGGEYSVRLFQRLVKLARECERNRLPASRDPEIRQRLAALEAHVLSHEYSGYRNLSRAANGKDGGVFPLVSKLYGTNVIGIEAARIALDLLGEHALVLPFGTHDKPHQPRNPRERWVHTILRIHANMIAGGTNNIQRNIIAERGLGLPRDS